MDNIIQRIFNKIGGKFIIKAFFGMSGLPRLTGKEWSEEKYLKTYDTSVYVFSCVKKIAEKVGDIEFKLFRIKNSKGDLEQILVHPLLDLLHHPNPYNSKTSFIKLKQINELLTGDAYWLKLKIGEKTQELWQLRPDWVKIVPDANDYIKEYIYRVPGQKEVRYEPDEIIHFNEPSPIKEFINRTGQSPIRPAQTRVDTEDFATKFQRDFFLNNARLDAVLQSDQPLTKEKIDDLRAKWAKKYKGVGKSSKIGILEAGLKYVQIATSQRDMDYIGGLKATRDDILTIYQVPKSVIAITDDVNRANAQAGMENFLRENIKPKDRNLTEVLNQFLVPEFGKDLVLDCVDPSPEDVELKLKIYKSGNEAGWLTQNEIRAKEGLLPIKGGDEPLVDKKLNTMVGLGMAVPFKKTILLGQPIKSDIFEGRGKVKTHIRIIELEADLKGQYEKRMGKLGKVKKKKYEDRKKEIWKTFLSDRNKSAKLILPDILKFLKGQEKRILEAISTEKKYKKQEYFKKYIKKAFDDIDWQEENEKLFAVIDPYSLKIAKIAGKDSLKRLGVDKPFITEGDMGVWLKEFAKVDATLINETTRKKLSKQLFESIEAGEGVSKLKDRVKGVYKIRSDAEAIRIARTESGRVINQATVESYKQTDVVDRKEWIATMDDRVRPAHAEADGQIVDKDKPFSVGGELKNAPNDINCRCAVAPVIVGDN